MAIGSKNCKTWPSESNQTSKQTSDAPFQFLERGFQLERDGGGSSKAPWASASCLRRSATFFAFAICFTSTSSSSTSAVGTVTSSEIKEGEGDIVEGAITPVSTRWSFCIHKTHKCPFSEKQECASQVGCKKQEARMCIVSWLQEARKQESDQVSHRRRTEYVGKVLVVGELPLQHRRFSLTGLGVALFLLGVVGV